MRSVHSHALTNLTGNSCGYFVYACDAFIIELIIFFSFSSNADNTTRICANVGFVICQRVFSAVSNDASKVTYTSTSGTISSIDYYFNFYGSEDMTFVISSPYISKIKLTVTDFDLGWCDTTCKCNTSCACSALQVSYTLCDAVKQPKCLPHLKTNSRCDEY
jgi:hypothetical protein